MVVLMKKKNDDLEEAIKELLSYTAKEIRAERDKILGEAKDKFLNYKNDLISTFSQAQLELYTNWVNAEQEFLDLYTQLKKQLM